MWYDHIKQLLEDKEMAFNMFTSISEHGCCQYFVQAAISDLSWIAPNYKKTKMLLSELTLSM